MTTKFTPGPWHAVDFIQGDEGNLIDDHYNAIMAGAGFTDAETGLVGFQISGCISRADANLMTAAPDMYKALRNLCNGGSDGRANDWEMAEAALAKADGKRVANG